MKKIAFITLITCGLSSLMSCSNNKNVDEIEEEQQVEQTTTQNHVPHNYGGYYCPDNLGGFPAVDINDWQSVPVVNGRMATKEETQNGTSLISVDMEKYPNAFALDMKMPRLARFYNRHSGKNELIIVIQALNISNDSIVGFRYLNGGNGSARLNEVSLLSDTEIEETMTPSRFVTLNLEIDATKAKVWEVLTKPEYDKPLRAIYDSDHKLQTSWNTSTAYNFKYLNGGTVTRSFADNLYGNQYIQIDWVLGDYQYVEKFFVSENEETKQSNLVIACGPYGADFENQKDVLERWAQKVKELSEKS